MGTRYSHLVNDDFLTTILAADLMQIQTHVMSGWCLGNYAKLTPRERFCCMLAASWADLDGLGILAGPEMYWEYHHKLCHNLPFGLLLSAGLMLFSGRRWRAFVVYLGLFHLHLVMDYFGSGPDWGFYYLWPFSNWYVENPRAWEFHSWQNFLAAFIFLAWTLWIAVRNGRTPLEIIMPSLDKQLVQWLRQRFGWK
jgi:inner membrane protein